MGDKPISETSVSFKHQHSLSALELRIQLQSDDFSAAENKSQQYINISAVVFAVLSGFSVSQPFADIVVLILLLLLLGSSIFVFYHSLNSLKPRNWRQFVNTEEERKRLQNLVNTVGDLEYQQTLFENYLSILRDNDKILEIKRFHNRKARRGVYFQIWITLCLVLYRVFADVYCKIANC